MHGHPALLAAAACGLVAVICYACNDFGPFQLYILSPAVAHTLRKGGRVSTWEEVRSLPSIHLNIGAAWDRHPSKHFKHYVAVEAPALRFAFCSGVGMRFGCGAYCVCQPWIGGPLPLPDGSVSSILTEHCLEHVPWGSYAALLAEFHRLLKPSGHVRIALPDYAEPGNRFVLEQGLSKDPRDIKHVSFPTYASLRRLVSDSPFGAKGAQWYRFWDDEANSTSPALVHRPIDYHLGWVTRTDENVGRGGTCGGKKWDKMPICHSIVFDLFK
jgi:SAM-dependent methyltransferase